MLLRFCDKLWVQARLEMAKFCFHCNTWNLSSPKHQALNVDDIFFHPLLSVGPWPVHLSPTFMSGVAP